MPLAFISFEKKIWRGRGRFKIQLNARNVGGNGDLIPIGTSHGANTLQRDFPRNVAGI